MVLFRRNVRSSSTLYPISVRPDKKDTILDAVSQQTMTGMLDQLAYLAAYSVEMFNDLLKDANKMAERLVSLGSRAEQLAQSIPTLEQYISETNPYYFLEYGKANFRTRKDLSGGQLFTSQSLPSSLQDVYNRECIPPPKLAILNYLREDGRDCMKEYSNPTFFIDEWVAEQKRQADEVKAKRAADRAGKGAARKDHQQKQIRTAKLNRQKYDPMGLAPQKSPRGGPSPAPAPLPEEPLPDVPAAATSAYSTYNPPSARDNFSQPPTTFASPRNAFESAPTTIAIPPQLNRIGAPLQSVYETSPSVGYSVYQVPSAAPDQAHSAAPPAPPPPHSTGFSLPPGAAPPSPRGPRPASERPPAAPPAAPSRGGPPPPPPGPGLAPRPNAPPAAPPAHDDEEEYMATPTGAGGPPPPPPPGPRAPAPPPPPGPRAPPAPRAPAAPASAPVNVRSNLMQQIQQGKQLKKVEQGEEDAPAKPVAGGKGDGFNVEKILARRNALADSDSEEENGNEWD